MNCHTHPEKEAGHVCRLCGKAFCDACLVKVADEFFCEPCLAERIKPTNLTKEKQPDKTAFIGRDGEKKSRFLAFILSCVPGLGYFYLGLMNRGLQMMVFFFGAIFIATLIGFEELFAFLGPVAVFYSIFDTQQMVKEFNAGRALEDKKVLNVGEIKITQSWIGYVLIVVGVLALMRNSSFYFPYWFYVRQLLPGGLIIAAGAYILYRNAPKKGKE